MCIEVRRIHRIPKELMNQKKKPLALGARFFFFFPCGFGCKAKWSWRWKLALSIGMLCIYWYALPDGRMGIIYLFIYFQQ